MLVLKISKYCYEVVRFHLITSYQLRIKMLFKMVF